MKTSAVPQYDGINIFFFYEENIAMHRKEDSGNVFEFMVHIEGPALEFFFVRFTQDATTTMEEMDFSLIKAAFVKKFAISEAPVGTIRREMEAILDSHEFENYLRNIDAFYSKTGLNEEEKVGLLRIIAMKVPEMTELDFFRGSTLNYETMKKSEKCLLKETKCISIGLDKEVLTRVIIVR